MLVGNRHLALSQRYVLLIRRVRTQKCGVTRYATRRDRMIARHVTFKLLLDTPTITCLGLSS